jgi:hypothetical protein
MNGMFLRTFVAAALLLAASASFAQQPNSDAGFVAPKSKKVKVDAATVDKPSPYDIDGVVAQAFKMKKPLELVNPLAPQKYGGSEDISWDPDNPEIPKGFILFGIRW